MEPFDLLLHRNHMFVADSFVGGLPIRPRLNTLILSCADSRVDPAHVFGLEPGEAVVLRNVGGRVTPGIVQQLRMLLQVPTATPPPTDAAAPPPFQIIILHHTDCGITRLAQNPPLMADFFSVPLADLPAKAIDNPHAAVAVDVAALHTGPGLPAAIQVSGVVYHTETGLVEVVVPPAPLRVP